MVVNSYEESSHNKNSKPASVSQNARDSVKFSFQVMVDRYAELAKEIQDAKKSIEATDWEGIDGGFSIEEIQKIIRIYGLLAEASKIIKTL